MARRTSNATHAPKEFKPAVTAKPVEQPKPAWTEEQIERYLARICENVKEQLSDTAAYLKVEAKARKALDEGGNSFDSFLRWSAGEVFYGVAAGREYYGFWRAVTRQQGDRALTAYDWLALVREVIAVRVIELRDDLVTRASYGISKQSTSAMHTYAERVEFETQADCIKQYDTVAREIEGALEQVTEERVKRQAENS